MKYKVFALIIIVVLVVSLSYSMEEKKGMIFQRFKLEPGAFNDPYALFFPLEVTGPGKVWIYVDVKKGEKNHAINVALVDVRVFDDDKDSKMDKDLWQMWMDFEDKYVPVKLFTVRNLSKPLVYFKRSLQSVLGKKEKPPKWLHGKDKASLGNNARIEHVIDDSERMVTEGKYVVQLLNENKSKIEGEILIDFPGEIFDVERDLWEEIPNKADLLVKDISLGRGNRIVVTIAKDKGFMPDALWKQRGDKAVVLQVTAGDKVFETKLPEFDPKRNLKYGEINYTIPDIEITGETSVTVFIDATNQVAERSKANNKKTVTLNPKEKSGPRQK
ncbi:MAG: hypothetical protein WHV26_08350 [Spirochaetota bacterium]